MELEFFNEAISLDHYMDKLEQEESLRIYEQFTCPEDDEFIEVLREKQPKILVVTENSCSDAMLNNPILQKVAEAANLDVRVVDHNANPTLFNNYLNGDNHSMLTYLLLDSEGEIIAKWGPRAEGLQQYMDELQKDLPPKEAGNFAERKQELLAQLTAEFTSKPEHWLAVYEDIRKTFFPAIQKVS